MSVRWIASLLNLLLMVSAGGVTPLKAAVLLAPPYGGLSVNNEPQGIYPDLLNALSRESGIPIQLEVVPFARAAQSVALASVDISMMFSNAYTQGKVIETGPVFLTEQIVQTRADTVVASRFDLSKLLIGRARGGCLELANDTSQPWRFYDLDTQEQGVKMLLAKRIDAFCTASEALDYAAKLADPTKQLSRKDRLVLMVKPVWLMFASRVDVPTRTALTEALKHLQKSGEMAKIFRRQLGDQYVLKLD